MNGPESVNQRKSQLRLVVNNVDNPERARSTVDQNPTIQYERPLLGRLWNRWETALKVGIGVSLAVGTTSYTLSYSEASQVIYPELYDLSVWTARAMIGLLGLYAASRSARWITSACIEAVRNHHFNSDIWHHIDK